MLAILDDDVLHLIAVALAKTCWRSLCDLACSSRRNASLPLTCSVWREAATLYYAGEAGCAKHVQEFYSSQRECLERMLTTRPPRQLRDGTTPLEYLQQVCPLLSGRTYTQLGSGAVLGGFAVQEVDHQGSSGQSNDSSIREAQPPFDAGMLALCAPVPDTLLSILALAARLPQTSPLSSFVGSEWEPMALSVHAAMHKVTDLRHPPGKSSPLRQLVIEALAPLEAFTNVPPPRGEESSLRRRYNSIMMRSSWSDDSDHEAHIEKARKIAEWLAAWSAGELCSLLGAVISSLEPLLARACADEAAVMNEASSPEFSAVPATVWRALVVQNVWAKSIRGMYKYPGTREPYHAAWILSDSAHLKHLSARGMVAMVELAFQHIFEQGVRGEKTYSYDSPFNIYARNAADHFDKVTATFRDADGRHSVASMIDALPEEAWECDWGEYPGNGMGYRPILHWFAFHVLDRAETEQDRRRWREERDDSRTTGSWHLAWGPDALRPEQHATLLAIRMRWSRGWTRVTSYDMLLSPESSWEPRVAASIIHKALRQAGIDEFLPNNVWHIWKKLAEEKRQDETSGSSHHEYKLSASVCWQLADRWLGARARCSALFMSSLLHLCSVRRDDILACAGLERRRMLQAAAVQASARILRVGPEQDQQDSDAEDSQMESDDSCAVAEAGWGEWSWSLPS